jgi:hypothetical protein
MNDNAEPAIATRIECPAAKDPAVRLFIGAAGLLGFGAWCFYDAFLSGGEYSTLPPDATINQTLGYWFNHGGGILFPVLALIPLALAARFLRRRIVADAEGIGYAGKDKIAWDTVEKLDTSRWASKGILVIRAAGDVSLSLDEWKLDKKTFRDLIALVENSVPPEAR